MNHQTAPGDTNSSTEFNFKRFAPLRSRTNKSAAKQKQQSSSRAVASVSEMGSSSVAVATAKKNEKLINGAQTIT
jgi:hypothetical protein